jgi:hypothetical protein
VLRCLPAARTVRLAGCCRLCHFISSGGLLLRTVRTAWHEECCGQRRLSVTESRRRLQCRLPRQSRTGRLLHSPGSSTTCSIGSTQRRRPGCSVAVSATPPTCAPVGPSPRAPDRRWRAARASRPPGPHYSDPAGRPSVSEIRMTALCVTPKVCARASQLDVDLAQVQGTGAGGPRPPGRTSTVTSWLRSCSCGCSRSASRARTWRRGPGRRQRDPRGSLARSRPAVLGRRASSAQLTIRLLIHDQLLCGPRQARCSPWPRAGSPCAPRSRVGA